MAVLKREVDPMYFVLVCLTLVSLVVVASVLNEKVMATGNYAMDEMEMYLPAL